MHRKLQSGVLRVSALLCAAALCAQTAASASAPISPAAGAKNLSPSNVSNKRLSAREQERVTQLSQRNLFSNDDENFIVRLASHNPNSSTAHALLSIVLKKNGYAELACEQAEQAWRLNRGEPRLLLAAIKGRIESGFENEGLKLAQEGATSYAHDYDTLLQLTILMQLQKQHESALKIIELAERLKPGKPELLLARVQSLLASGLFDQAEEPARRLVAIKQTTAPGLLALAKIAQHRSLSAQAEQLLKRAYELAPQDAEICRLYFQVLSDSGQHLQALEPGLLAVAVLTGGAQAKQIKLTIIDHLDSEKLPQLHIAANCVAKRLPAAKQLSFLYFCLGDICDHIDETVVAIKYYQLGLQVNPSYGRAYMRLARDLEKTGQPPSGLTPLYAEAARLSPRDNEVQQALLRNEVRTRGQGRDIAGRLKSALYYEDLRKALLLLAH